MSLSCRRGEQPLASIFRSDLNGQRQLVSSLMLGSHRRWPTRHEGALVRARDFCPAHPDRARSGDLGMRYEVNGPKCCLILTVDGTFGL